MRVGALRHMIQFQEVAKNTDTFGGQLQQWVKHCDVWAEYVDGSNRSVVAAQRNNVEITGMFRIRFRADITEKMRIIHGGLVYSIIAPVNPGLLNKELQVFVSTGLREN